MRQSNEIPEGTPAPEVMQVTATRIACDGGLGALGHPRVWLTIDPGKGWIDCGYCDRRFVLKGVDDRSTESVEPAPGRPGHATQTVGRQGG